MRHPAAAVKRSTCLSPLDISRERVPHVFGVSQVMPPAKKKRSRSAPPAARAQAVAAETSPAAVVAVTELEQLPDGKGYDSLDEADGPPQPSADCLVLEEEELVGLDDFAPRNDPDAEPPPKAPAVAAAAHLARPAAAATPTAGPSTVPQAEAPVPVSAEAAATVSPRRHTVAVARSPTRAAMVDTGAAAATKKLTAAQEKSPKSAGEWTEWAAKQDTSLRFGRPEFAPYKEGLGPAGFVRLPSHDKGGPRAGHGFTSQTHPAVFVAAQSFDSKMFNQLEEATNEYAASKGAGKSTFWKEWKPFDTEEIMAGCGLVLRAGVAPSPQIDLVFSDPSLSFIWGDERVRKVWPGTGCGGSERRFVSGR